MMIFGCGDAERAGGLDEFALAQRSPCARTTRANPAQMTTPTAKITGAQARAEHADEDRPRPAAAGSPR